MMKQSYVIANIIVAIIVIASNMNAESNSFINKKWILKSRPQGPYSTSNAELCDDIIPADLNLESGEVIVEVCALSIDGFLRTMMDENAYHGSLKLGDVLPAIGIGTVVKSNSSKLKVGAKVTGMLGAQKYSKTMDSSIFAVMSIPVNDLGASLYDPIGLLGITGLTAWTGLFCTNVSPPKKGETVVVSAAAGATGSIAAQLAKTTGARVIGIAGGSEKTKFLREVLKLDDAADYKSSTESLEQQLDRICPDGVDYYFDNVGGSTLDLILNKLRPRGRIVICGAISQYSGNLNVGTVQGPSNYLKLAEKGCTMTGFNLMMFTSSFPQAIASLMWHKYWGNVVMHEHIECGIESFSKGIEIMFSGGHIGRLIIQIKPENSSVG